MVTNRTIDGCSFFNLDVLVLDELPIRDIQCGCLMDAKMFYSSSSNAFTTPPHPITPLIRVSPARIDLSALAALECHWD